MIVSRYLAHEQSEGHVVIMGGTPLGIFNLNRIHQFDED